MEPTLPAFIPGAPGGPELLIMLFMIVFMIGVPLAVIAGAIWLFTGRTNGDDSTDQRVAELEREVDRLQREVDRLESEREDATGREE